MAFHAACVSCVPAFYPFSLHKMLSCTFKLPKKMRCAARGERFFIAKEGRENFRTVKASEISSLSESDRDLILESLS